RGHMDGVAFFVLAQASGIAEWLIALVGVECHDGSFFCSFQVSYSVVCTDARGKAAFIGGAGRGGDDELGVGFDGPRIVSFECSFDLFMDRRATDRRRRGYALVYPWGKDHFMAHARDRIEVLREDALVRRARRS